MLCAVRKKKVTIVITSFIFPLSCRSEPCLAFSYFAHTQSRQSNVPEIGTSICTLDVCFPQGAAISIRITHGLYLILLGTYYETLRVVCFITLLKSKCNEMTLWINRSNRSTIIINNNNNSQQNKARESMKRLVSLYTLAIHTQGTSWVLLLTCSGCRMVINDWMAHVASSGRSTHTLSLTVG